MRPIYLVPSDGGQSRRFMTTRDAATFLHEKFLHTNKPVKVSAASVTLCNRLKQKNTKPYRGYHIYEGE